MRPDYLIALLLAMAAFPFGAAVMAAPLYWEILRHHLALLIWGGMMLTVALLGLAVFIAFKSDALFAPGAYARSVALTMMIFCLVGCLCSAVIYFWPNSSKPDTAASSVDDPNGWSISFRCKGPLQSMWDSNFSFVAMDLCSFINLSNKQRRIIDVKLVIPINDSQIHEVILNTETMDKQSYGDLVRHSGKQLGRIWKPLDNPVVVEPGSLVQGWIEFPLPTDLFQRFVERGMNSIDLMDLDHTTVTFTEHISGRSVQMPYGYDYDAIKGVAVAPDNLTNPPAATPPSPTLLK